MYMGLATSLATLERVDLLVQTPLGKNIMGPRAEATLKRISRRGGKAGEVADEILQTPEGAALPIWRWSEEAEEDHGQRVKDGAGRRGNRSSDEVAIVRSVTFLDAHEEGSLLSSGRVAAGASGPGTSSAVE